ncbi:MAG: hypothetical protein ACLQLO_04020 [Mycobacterium sp.]
MHYPLRVKDCHQCWLVQTEGYARAEELFSARPAASSTTRIPPSWRNSHA